MRYLAYELLTFFLAWSGFRGVRATSHVLGEALWRALPSRRRLARETIAARLNVSSEEAEHIARQSFHHNARSFLELTLSRRMDWRFVKDYVDIMHPERMRRLGETRTPRVIVTAHLGAWEMSWATRLFCTAGSNLVVARRGGDPDMHQVITRLRARPNVAIINHRQAAFPVLRHLRKGGLAAFLVDHNTSRGEAIFLPFLGKLAAVNQGPALLAARAGAEVWPGFVIRHPGNRVGLYLEEPLRAQELEGSRQEKVERIAAFYTAAVESYVRRFPEQWFWMHKRWKTRPEGEAEGASSSK